MRDFRRSVVAPQRTLAAKGVADAWNLAHRYDGIHREA
jgi:hypothetical protein